MLVRAVWILVLVFAVEARAGTEIDHEFSGRLNVESRWFPEAGAHPGQRSHASGFVTVPELYLEDAAGRSLTFTPFFRYDNTDSRRTHADLAEAYLLLFGGIGDGEWELRAGVDQVFWASPNRSTWSISSTKSISSNIRPESQVGATHGPFHLV